jgi:hypothetical protein
MDEDSNKKQIDLSTEMEDLDMNRLEKRSGDCCCLNDE